MPFWFDLRQAVRISQRSPYVTAAAILSIGLAVGSGAAVFSWMDGLVLHPFPAVADQTRLVGLEVGPPNGGMGAWLYQTFKELREATHSFTGLAAWRIIRVSTREPNEMGSASLLATTVSGRYFDVLGVTPIIGRLLLMPTLTRRRRSSCSVISTGWLGIEVTTASLARPSF